MSVAFNREILNRTHDFLLIS